MFLIVFFFIQFLKQNNSKHVICLFLQVCRNKALRGSRSSQFVFGGNVIVDYQNISVFLVAILD